MSNKLSTQPVTLREVAAAAQVSVSTASRALTDGRYVSADKLHRIREAAESIGYQPHEGARSLRNARTMTIGLVSRDLRTPAMMDLIGGMTEAAEEEGYSVFIGNAAGRIEAYRTLVRRLFERRADALLLISPEGVAKEAAAFEESGRPVLAALSLGQDCELLPLVYSDEGSAMRQALSRLRELGHRSVAYFMNPWEVRSQRPIFTEAIAAEMGLTYTLAVTGIPPNAADLAEELERVMAGPIGVTAIVLSHGALGPFLMAARQLGVGIPRDLSVFTFSDSPHTQGLTVPSMATIHTDLHEMGGQVIRLLIAALNGEEFPSITDVALSSWAESESVGPAPGPAGPGAR